jgi:hypothetical protein
MINVHHGSIFDSKCDLLVVPCDSGGGVTRSVQGNLSERGLPTYVGRIPYGKVHFRESNYEFANTVAYAASVDGATIESSSHAIESIAGEIVSYSRANQIRKVNIPLLGTGAGGMTPVDSFEALRSVFKGNDDVAFNIFCLTREAYQNIQPNTHHRSEDAVPKHPRVFISYTGLDKNNALWVKALANALRVNVVDARLDLFHLKPGFDLPQWMTNEVVMADKVLLICDKYYAEKADFRKGGVGWETMIIQGDMLAQGDNKQKYIAILRDSEGAKTMPTYMKSKYAFNWGIDADIDPARLKDLVLCIFDCDTEPALGPVPDYVRELQIKAVAAAK